jgi:hypothetical protein
MPEVVKTFPSAGASSLPWADYTDGQVYLFSKDEVKELGITFESLRATAHAQAKEMGTKFKTRLTDDGLFIMAR